MSDKHLNDQPLPKTDDNRQQTAHLRQLFVLLLISFGLIALSLLFWGVLRADAILARGDNPRLVEAELRILRGVIIDRNGLTLAENGGTAARQQRRYPIPNIGPAVGYYSFRHGTAGVEESYNAILRGDGTSFWVDAWRRLLHKPKTGQAIQLTLDAVWQQQADNLLADHAGAVLLLELERDNNLAQIRVLVSHPIFDPNQLDEQFDTLLADETAPLLNRVTQGLYQPGLVLQPFLLGQALGEEQIQLRAAAENANRPVALDGVVRRCAVRPPEPATWADVLAYRCPGPLLDLGSMLGTTELTRFFANWAFTTQPELALNTETPPQEEAADAALAAIGQDNLTITPLQAALAWAALGNNGRFPTLQLVTAVQDESGSWNPETLPANEAIAITPEAAQAILRALPTHNRVAEYSVLVLSGPEGSSNGWYLALAPATTPRYALVVVVENTASEETAVAIGRALLETIGD